MPSSRPGFPSGPPSGAARIAVLVLAVLAVLAAVPVALVSVAWAATNVGTVVAVALAALVYVPPFVLFWGETHGRKSVWGWRSPQHFDRDLRRLLDEDSPPQG